jgi:hypothetical protein
MMAVSSSINRRSDKNLQELKLRGDLFSNRRKKPSSTASEAQHIQKSLMRTQHLLKNESQRVSNLTATIEEDGKKLEETMGHHKSFNTKGAQKALTALERAQQREQRILIVSVFFFFLVVFHVMWSRVFAKFGFIGGIFAIISPFN